MKFSVFFRAFCTLWGLAGSAVILLIASFYGNALSGIFSLASEADWRSILTDSYFHHVLWFSFGQALLSALLSLFIGFWVARAFFYQRFWGKKGLLKVISLTFVLPVLVAIFGLIGVLGHSGWLSQLFSLFGIPWRGSIYGLSGILLAHLFFNIPLATRLFIQALQNIPSQQRQLAAQLNLRGWRFIRWVEWYYVRQQMLPVFSLIFMLCFTSFTVVLTLGGGPQYSTLETAIYQAILFDFDLPKAAFLAVLQLICCISLFLLSNWLQRPVLSPQQNRHYWCDKQSRAVRFWQIFILILFSFFVLTPLINTLFSALQVKNLWNALQQESLWRATGFSLAMAVSSGLVALVVSVSLLMFSRQFQRNVFEHSCSSWLSNVGMMTLAIPTIVLAIGLFLRWQTTELSAGWLFFLVVICNALAAMPFVLRVLSLPFQLNQQRYQHLCLSLGIRGWVRLRWVEWYSLRAPLQYAFALGAMLSLGDFTAIALFGNQDFISLPYLLYQQLGTYRSEQAAVTSGVLLLCIGLFGFIETQKGKNDSLI